MNAMPEIVIQQLYYTINMIDENKINDQWQENSKHKKLQANYFVSCVDEANLILEGIFESHSLQRLIL